MARTEQEQRVKLLSDGVAAARELRMAHAPPVPLLPAFSTLESGQVINHKGEVVFTPPKLPPLGKKPEAPK